MATQADGERSSQAAADLEREIAERKRVEEALAAQQVLLRTIVELVTDRVFVKDTASRFVINNAAHLDALGLKSQEEALGKTDFDIFPKQIAQRFYDDEQQVVHTGKPLIGRFEQCVHPKHGKQWLQTVKVPLRDASGAIVGLVGISRDITALKRADEALRMSQQRLALAQEAAQIGTFEWIIPTGQMIWTEQLERLYGLAPGDFRGQYEDWRQAIHPEDRERAEAEVSSAVKDKKELDIEFRIVRPDGDIRWINARAKELSDDYGGPQRMIGVQMDITESRRIQQQIHELNAALQKRAGQLQEANKDLEAFAYSVSHDLRAPLRTVEGLTRILMEKHAPQLAEDPRQLLQLVRQGTQRMSNLIEDMLTLSRLGRQALKKQTVSLADLVRYCLDELRAEQEGRRIKIIMGELPDCQADRAMLKQVFANLLSNALKFTRNREEAVIEIGCLPPEQTQDERVYFVKDNGAGFDMSSADRLFGVFQRLHTPDEYPGTGVGLAIVQRIIQRHGGRVWAEATVDKGATFYFTLEGDGSPA